MLRGLVNDELERLTAQLSEATRAESVDQPGSLTRAWVKHGFASPMAEMLDFGVSSGALAVVAEDPQLLKPAQEWFGELNERLQNDRIDPVLATIVRLTRCPALITRAAQLIGHFLLQQFLHYQRPG